MSKPSMIGTSGGLRTLGTLGTLLALVSCAARLPPTFDLELGQAQALVQRGCYDCLEDALAIYERVAGADDAPSAAARGAFHASLLLLVRSRELGLPDAAPHERAQHWATRLSPAASGPAGLSAASYLDAVRLVHGELSGLPMEERERLNRERRAAWPGDGTPPLARAMLAPFVASDVVAQYLAVAIDCEDARARKTVNHEEILARFPYPLMRFRVAVCGIPDLPLDPLRQADAVWVDTLFFEGRSDMSRLAIDVSRAAELFAAAHEAFPASMAITLALANARNMLEEHEAALALFDGMLATAPTHREALLGRLVSLSYLRRPYDAIRTATRMIELGTYHLGDAYYWRAWNRYQVHDLSSASSDVERARTLMVSSAVSTLAGFIAYAQRDLDTANTRLDEAHRLDPANCEAAWTDGLVHVDREAWDPAAARFMAAVHCYANEVRAAREEMRVHDAAADASRRRRALAARKRAEGAEHRRAQAAFNAAASYLRLGKKADAILSAEIAATHAMLKDKATALLATIARLP